MKKFISFFATNGLMLLSLYFAYLFPQYSWFIKSSFIIITFLSILTLIYYISDIEELPKNIKDKFDSTLYNVLDHTLDVIFLVIFILLDWRFVAISYAILVFFLVILKLEYRKSKEEK